MLLCPKCNTPFLADTPHWPHHPRVDMEALRSNVLPSPQVISQVNALARAEKVDLKGLDETIKRVQDTLKELQNRRNILCQEIQRRRSWKAPIRRLPVDVLKEIFTYVCLGDDRNGFSLDIRSKGREFRKITIAPTRRLHRVCFHWRSVTISTPSLWSSLRLDVVKMEEKHAALVDLYLRHSAQYPLKISLGMHRSIEAQYEDIEDVIDCEYAGQMACNVVCSVVKELYRCREFHYDSNTDTLIGVVPELFRPQSLPLLTNYSDRVKVDEVEVDEVEVDEVEEDCDGERWFWDLVKAAPNLADVSVEIFRRDCFPENLNKLTIDYEYQWSYQSLFEWLPHFPKLVSLNLHEISHPCGLPPFAVPTPHPIYTQNLKIRTTLLSTLEPLFSSVTFPSLSSLEIIAHQESSYPANDLGPLLALIRGSGCTLKELKLHVGLYPSSALISLLELQPSLVGLNLRVWMPEMGEPEPPVLVDLLARMADPQSSLLPCIQRFDIRGSAVSKERFIEIAISALDMVALRERQGEFIPNISLNLSGGYRYKGRDLPVDLEKRVKDLNERGVGCRIVFPWEVHIRHWLKGDRVERNSK
ncbi:hypothetical protein VNI00_002124 [Paramarasmius palmivorus]|uniref:F-box domain-containing protein n=1 Tax=Paramarasmius palmivorus TaxID=297713 RepID=A0AAW0E421_9AGAR